MPPKKRKSTATNGKAKKGKKRESSDDNDDFLEELDSPQIADVNDNDKVVSDTESINLELSSISGQLFISGSTNWDMTGRKQLPKDVRNIGGRNLWGANRVTQFIDRRVCKVVSGCTACHSIVITTDGKAYSWGRNTNGQLGHGDCLRLDEPTMIKALSGNKVVDAACGRNHTLVLTENGHVYGFGDNKMAQLGLGHQTPTITKPMRIHYNNKNAIKAIACGGEFSAMVDTKGHLYTFGCPENGVLGHNTDGKYFVKGNKMSYNCETRPRAIRLFFDKNPRDAGQITPVSDVCIISVACGSNHMLALDSNKRLFTFGFGGYGRLGHNGNKDEMVPRLLNQFIGLNRGITKIFAGSTFSMAISEVGCLYFWGQNKNSGEATMYPKPVNDLSGWNVRSVGCCYVGNHLIHYYSNKSIVVAADNSIVSWGGSPTYGELAYGESSAKSSTTPQEAKSLAKVYVHEVACGFAHTLFIVRDDDEEDRKAIETIPRYAGP